MPSATITSQGQTTIPKEIRDFLKLNPGDRIDFIIEENGRVVIQAATIEIQDLKGLLHREGMKPVSIEAMNAAVKQRQTSYNL